MIKVVEVNIEDVIPYVNNARTHSDEQVAQIAASIREFGWTNPILIDGDKGLIAGHGRVKAARKLGMATVPAIEIKDLTEAQKKALILADNKLALNAGWDYELLKLELSDLSEINYKMEILGFDENELTSIMFGEELEKKTAESQLINGVYEIVVECKDENEQQAVFDMLTERGYKCRVLTM
jgi:ParB-like chromosome segregation protein Spo0J